MAGRKGGVWDRKEGAVGSQRNKVGVGVILVSRLVVLRGFGRINRPVIVRVVGMIPMFSSVPMAVAPTRIVRVLDLDGCIGTGDMNERDGNHQEVLE